MKHCWHRAPIDGPYGHIRDVCCFCSIVRVEPMEHHPDRAKHGQYLPEGALAPLMIDRTDTECPRKASALPPSFFRVEKTLPA